MWCLKTLRNMETGLAAVRCRRHPAPPANPSNCGQESYVSHTPNANWIINDDNSHIRPWFILFSSFSQELGVKVIYGYASHLETTEAGLGSRVCDLRRLVRRRSTWSWHSLAPRHGPCILPKTKRFGCLTPIYQWECVWGEAGSTGSQRCRHE